MIKSLGDVKQVNRQCHKSLDGYAPKEMAYSINVVTVSWFVLTAVLTANYI